MQFGVVIWLVRIFKCSIFANTIKETSAKGRPLTTCCMKRQQLWERRRRVHSRHCKKFILLFKLNIFTTSPCSTSWKLHPLLTLFVRLTILSYCRHLLHGVAKMFCYDVPFSNASFCVGRPSVFYSDTSPTYVWFDVFRMICRLIFNFYFKFMISFIILFWAQINYFFSYVSKHSFSIWGFHIYFFNKMN